jgi:hypothetical protein
MATGYEPGVSSRSNLFLYRLKDIVQYVSLFTLGHSITLLAGALGGIHANSYAVDAIIWFSLVYKAFDTMEALNDFSGLSRTASSPS